MAFDTPARIAIVGAGPIGLEVALYARFLGYDVDIYEQGYVADQVRRWGHLRQVAPFRALCSPLGLAAIRTQDPDWAPPSPESLLTGEEWINGYLLPLSQTDLVAPHVHEQQEVLAIGHEELWRSDGPGSESRGDYDLQLLVRNSAGDERWVSADIVFDTSGAASLPNRLGPGGMPAAGELASRGRIAYGPPDVLGRDRPLYAGKRVVLVGADLAAAATLLALEQLCAAEPATSVVWVTHPSFRPDADETNEITGDHPPNLALARVPPVAQRAQDPYPARDALAAAANRLAADSQGWLTWIDQSSIRSIGWQSGGGKFAVATQGSVESAFEVDRVVACSGYRPNYALSSELPLEIDAVWEAPASIAAALAGATADDLADPWAIDPQSLLTSEPNFYVLGAKSYGRHPGFHFATGLGQIRALFSIIGERADLDLYATAGRLQP